MRILVQALVAAPGGTGTVTRDLLEAWPLDDELLVTVWRPSALQMFRSTNRDIVRLPARSTEEASIRFRLNPPTKIREFRPDVVWSLGFRLNVGAVPQAVHYHDIGSFIRIHPATARQRIKSLRERSDLKRTDLRIYNSATMRDAVHSRYPAAATRPHVVIHNGLNLTPFRTTQTEAARRRADRTGRSILLPQSDAPHKRNWLAADVLALLRDREPTSTAAQLTVTGSGDYLDLRERLKHHGLEDVTTFTGYVTRERMATLYAEHDAVLMTARAESFGNPIVEAHAASRPVITSPFPVAIELGGPLTHVATADDACSLADALHRALETPIDGGTIREARRFAQKFTASTAAQRISVALGAAVEAGRAGRRAG